MSCVLSLYFFNPLALRLPRLGKTASLRAFHAFVCFALVGLCLFYLPLGARDWLRFLIMALPSSGGGGNFLYMAQYGCACRIAAFFALPGI